MINISLTKQIPYVSFPMNEEEDYIVTFEDYKDVVSNLRNNLENMKEWLEILEKKWIFESTYLLGQSCFEAWKDNIFASNSLISFKSGKLRNKNTSDRAIYPLLDEISDFGILIPIDRTNKDDLNLFP